MNTNLASNLPLVRRSARAIKAALTNAYVENPSAPQSQLLLGLTIQAGEHLRAIATLLENEHYTQALIICRSCLETMAVAYGVVSDEKLTKLLEKKSLEQFKKRIGELGLLHRVSGLDETIKSIHSESTASLQVERLLELYGRNLWKADRNLFYASYRELCTYSHPDYLRLVETIKVHENGRGMTLNPHEGARDDHLHFGVGVAAAINTAFFAAYNESTGIQFSEKCRDELVAILNQALDLFARREP
jgi:hypothetical protein